MEENMEQNEEAMDVINEEGDTNTNTIFITSKF